jgi:hypothetical protein
MLSFWLLAPQVTFSSLVYDATELSGLCEYPEPAFYLKQASSYDRASVAPGQDSWFANRDWGNYVRDETVGSRKEHVLCDVSGAGVMVRYWSPNPAGTTRIYVDGALALEAKSQDLLGGRLPTFPPPVSQETSAGWTLYYPIAYQKSLKVTVDDSDQDAAARMYYQIQYRTYAEGVSVEPFYLAGGPNLARRMMDNPGWASPDKKEWHSASGESVTLTGPRKISAVVVKVTGLDESKEWSSASRAHNVLRDVWVSASFDGETCIEAPLGDLMSTSVGLNKLSSMPAWINESGDMVLRCPMPFRESARFSMTSPKASSVKVSYAFVSSKYVWSDRSMHFKAQWLNFKGGTRPMRDLDFLNATGQGVFAGCNVAISNPTPDWWGEGDEKIYVDGESFPSTFGTGTEDYFGYGWSNPKLFEHPYHYQSHCDGPGTKGHSSIGRWQILDRIPFQTSFRFDMELWHWADVQMQYGRTVFWYAKPGGSAPRSHGADESRLAFIDTSVPRVKGALEGEDLEIIALTGGTTERQDFAGLSNGKQLWWRDGSKSHELRLAVPVAVKGRYRVFLRACTAEDYGIHDIWFGTISRQIDFYGKLKWKTFELGTTFLDAGKTPFRVWVYSSNPKAIKRHMFGIDYILLVRES